MKNLAAPLIGMGIIPTTRGSLDAFTVAKAPKDQKMNVFKSVTFDPMSSYDRSGIAQMYATGDKTPGFLN